MNGGDLQRVAAAAGVEARTVTEPKLVVEPFASEHDCQQVIDYFHGADDALLQTMGVDRARIPPRDQWLARMLADLERPIAQRSAYYLSWRLDGTPVGHSSVSQVVFREQAFVHLHLWHPQQRHRGLGLEFFRRSVRIFTSTFELKRLLCEPHAENAAPNRTLERAGFRLVKRYWTIPGALNFAQYVNRWELAAPAHP